MNISDLLNSIKKLECWAEKSDVDISQDLASINSKVKAFLDKTKTDEALLKASLRTTKLKNLEDRIIKVKKQKAGTVSFRAEDNSAPYIPKTPKPTEHKSVKPSKASQQKNGLEKPNAIDFTARSKLIKGISCCYFCKIMRLECREHKAFSGLKVLICKDCRNTRNKNYAIGKHEHFKREDALNYTIPGSYGSGKLGR